jgi:hypothetical protein
LGLGEKKVVIPFDELELEGDQVVMVSRKSEDVLENKSAYDPGEYESIVTQ